MLQHMQPLSGNQRPDPLTALMNMSLAPRLPRKMQLYKSSSNALCLPSFLEMPQNPHVTLTFDKVYNPLRLPRKTTLQRPKVARACGALCILTWECASRHNGVHFFDISTSKIAPELRCFVHFDFEMCFAPQRRAHFRHQLPKVLRNWGVLNFFTCKFASRHNGVHFFDISTSKSARKPSAFLCFWLWNVLRATTACNFSSLIWPAGSAPAALASLLFDPPEPQVTGKTQGIATFLPFRALGSSFFWEFLFFDLLSSSVLFSGSSHLCF